MAAWGSVLSVAFSVMYARSALRSWSAWAGVIALPMYAILTLLPAPARADCFLNGPTVTCTPPGTGGFTAANDGLNVTVQQDATVSVTGFGNAGNKVNNTSTLPN